MPEICGKWGLVSSGVPWGLPPRISALSRLCFSLQCGHTDRAEEEAGLQVLPLVPGECLPRAHVSAAPFQGWGPVTRGALSLHPSTARLCGNRGGIALSYQSGVIGLHFHQPGSRTRNGYCLPRKTTLHYAAEARLLSSPLTLVSLCWKLIPRR